MCLINDIKLLISRARYYDPSSGRFLSEDPIGFSGKDFNFYRYTTNNPVTYNDPTGLENSSPSDYAGAGATFTSTQEAAYSVLSQVSDFSINNNVEVGGYLYKGDSGQYGYSGSVLGSEGSVTITSPLNSTGTYHTHGANDPKYQSKYFSQGDIDAHTLGQEDFMMNPNKQMSRMKRESKLGGETCNR